MSTVTRTLPARTTTRTAVPTLPGAGPAWWGAVMGTGILATLTVLQLPDGPVRVGLSLALLAADWLLAIALTLGFAARVVRHRAAWWDSLRGVARSQWGMVSMGVLSVGSATSTVLPAAAAQWSLAAWRIDELLWVSGTAVGVVAALGVLLQLVRHGTDTPSTLWGLAVVAPMVSATTGGALATHLLGRAGGQEAAIWVLAVATGCFFLSLTTGPVVFALAYHHHWRVAPVPLAATASVWIPLGIVGQSTAAAQAIATPAALLAPAHAAEISRVASGYGAGVLLLGIPFVAWAVVVTVRGLRARMPFSPGWWALTFPIGTLSLGSHLLGVATAAPWLVTASLVAWLVLCGTWTLCSVASVRAVVRSWGNAAAAA